MQGRLSATDQAITVSQPGGGRLFYLDAVRAFAMFFGIFSHGSTIAHQYIDVMPPFMALQFYNDLFRAATFFLVSGFFTALVYEKNDLKTYARTRFEIIVVPLVCSMIFVVPITNWLIHAWHNGAITAGDYFGGGWRNPTLGNDTWALHIWFLWSLAIYAVLAPFLAIITDSRPFNRLLEVYLDKTAGFTHWTNVLIFAVGVMVGRGLYDQIFRHVADDTPFHWIVRATLANLPIFFLGMVAFRNRRFLETLSVLSIPGLLVFGFLYWAVATYGGDLPRNLERVLFWTARGGLSLFVITSILWFFRKFANKPGKWLTFFVNSAYSFYIFHFTFIYLVAWGISRFTGNLYLTYLAILLIATPLTLLWHAFVIDKVPLLRFMFTGKWSQRAAETAKPQPAG
jgi:glucan biosynthesis protein C